MSSRYRCEAHPSVAMRFLPTRRRISWSFRETYGCRTDQTGWPLCFLSFRSSYLNVSLKIEILNYEFLIGYGHLLEKFTRANKIHLDELFMEYFKYRYVNATVEICTSNSLTATAEFPDSI